MRFFPRRQPARIALAIFGLFAAGYVAAAVYMAINQRAFLYRVAPAWIAPETQGIPRAEAFRLANSPASAPGEPTLAGWWVPPTRDDAPVFLYFHGNANGLDRRAKRFGLLTADGSGLLAMSYRGYGGSEGNPTEAALHADAERIHAALAAKVAPERIVIFGESLGSGVALNLARKAKARALILDSPYVSILSRGQASYPWLPVSWLLTDTFRSDLWIAEAKIPTLIIHGTADVTIPVEESAALATRAKNGNVTRKIYPGEPHVVPLDKGPLPDILAFLAAAATRP